MEASRRIERTYKTAQKFMSNGGNVCNAFSISVSYVKGGMSFYDYHVYPSGYRVSYTPMALSDKGGYECRSTIIGDGFYAQGEEAARFNRKRLEEYASKIFANLNEWLSEHGLSNLCEQGYQEA